ncbi:MAG: ATP synthase F1 subunit delta [Bdellovibrionales bacterium]|nr:ATP synthase F1 subunit delta [Bdellovibrionales bacterium]
MASNDNQLALRYAKAFFQVLVEMNVKDLSLYEKDLQFLKVLSEGDQGAFFKSPLFEAGEKEQVIEKIFESFKAQKETKAFVFSLNRANHIYLIHLIAHYFSEVLLESQERVRVQISTAYPLEDKDEKKITSIFEKTFGKDVVIETKIDSNLIGGISANVGGVVYDASIAGYLARLEKQFNA